MMKFNDTKETVEERTKKENYEGGVAYDPDTAEMALFKNCVNNLLEDTYYESDEEQLLGVKKSFNSCASENPEAVLKIAKFCRQEAGLRDVSQLLLVLASNDERTKEYVREYGTDIIDRADEPCTVVAMQKSLFGDSIPRPLRDVINAKLNEFDEYELSKYDRDGREVNLKDVINLTHPKPKDDEHDELFERLIYGELDDYPDVEPLDAPKTWEVEVSEAVKEATPDDFIEAKKKVKSSDSTGEDYEPNTSHWAEGEAPDPRGTKTVEKKAAEKAGYDYDDIKEMKREAKKEAFEDLLESGKMGLFARIRNVRNMLDVGVDGSTIFGDVGMEWVRSSKVYPFRFYQSYKAMKDAGMHDDDVERFLSNAIDTASDNLDDDLTSTFTAVDLSGSMNASISNRSDLNRDEIGALFGAIMMRNGSSVGAFGSDFAEVRAHSETPTLELQEKIMSESAAVGNATNGHLAIQHLIENDLEYDRVVIFSDMQMWDTSVYGNNASAIQKAWGDYKDMVNEDAKLYLIDLAAYGDLEVPEGRPDVFQVSGWSSNVLDFIQYAERPREIIATIEEEM